MATQRNYYRSFGGGEVSQDMWGRIDDGKYQTGLAECRNFMVRPQGPIENRPGTTFVSFAKFNDKRVRLVPFVYSSDQSMVLEMGDGYMRFHSQGLTLMNGGVPYEIITPFTEQMLFDIHYVQSADVMTFVHPSCPPQELRRFGALDWRIGATDFAPTAPPADVLATATVSDGMPPSITYSYVVTRVRDGDGSESTASAASSVTNNLYVTGNKNTITWTAGDAGTREYLVYKMQGGLFGYIGRTTGTSLVDDNIGPDMSRTPPHYDDTLQNNPPAAVSYYEQRKVFAGSWAMPQQVWMTRSGTESQMTYSMPVRDDDRISFRVAAREVNAIRHIVPLSNLLLLTAAGEWRVTSVNSDAITPTSVSVKPQSYVGSSNVQPLVVNNTALFASERGNHIHEIGYNWQANGYITSDLSLRNAGLFDLGRIVDMAYQKAPYPVVWAVNYDGRLFGLTYVPEQQVGAWHVHTTQDGMFETCCVVPDLPFTDSLYVVVKRKLNGQERRCIERMHWRVVQNDGVKDAVDAYFVDCGVSYGGAAISTLGGLGHLNGMKVNVLADGVALPPQTVVNGVINLPRPASTIQAGLPIDAYVRTLPATAMNDTALGQGRLKNVNKVWLRVQRSGAFYVGPARNMMREWRAPTWPGGEYGAASSPAGMGINVSTNGALSSGEVEVPIDGVWMQGGGQVYIEQRSPLPLTVLGMTAEIVFGG